MEGRLRMANGTGLATEATKTNQRLTPALKPETLSQF